MLDRKMLADMLVQSAEYLLEKADYLSEIDSRFGDGDHGITIGKIAVVLKEKAA